MLKETWKLLFTQNKYGLELNHDRCTDTQSYHHGSLEIFLHNTARTEQISVCKVLCGHISDGQLGQHHFSARFVDLLQLIVQNVPFSINNGLIFLQTAT